MSSLRQLVAGIAHKINNLINVERRKGRLNCVNASGGGATFIIEIPRLLKRYTVVI